MPHIFLKQHLQFWYLFASGFFMLWIGLVVALSLLVSGEAYDNALVVVGVTGILGGFQFIMGSMLILISRRIEAYRINAVLQDTWLICPQVDNAKVWQKSAEAYWQRFQSNHKFPVMQLLTATVIVLGVGIYSFAMGAEWLFLPIFAGILMAFYGIIGGHHQFARWQYGRFYQFHQNLDIPQVYIGENDFYSEMLGYQSLRGLIFIQLLTSKDINSPYKTHVKAPSYPPFDTFNFPELDKYVADKGWGFLELSIRQYTRRMSYTHYVHIRIPRAQFAEAEAVVTRLKERYRLK